MTPQQFAGAYLHTAQLVTAGTGIDAYVLLAQWANETDWGNVVIGNNLANIRCSPTTFCQYATLEDFAQACIATFHNGYYGAVLAATTPVAQLAAIVASPWDSGHYGGSLAAFYFPPAPAPKPVRRRSTVIVSTTKSLHQFCRGTDLALYHRRRASGAWSPWAGLGGRLGSPEIVAGVDDQGTIIVSVVGANPDGSSNALFYDFVSTDDGLTFAAAVPNAGGGDGLTTLAVLEPSGASSAVATLSPLQAQQLQEAHDAIQRIEAAEKSA
jgi:hypothetical protein